jgi:MtN3 and saliva related transmembrane protein
LSPDPVGWVATAILIATIGRQASAQWRETSTKGVSQWLYVGQIAASIGFVIYSAMLGNVVFVVSNVFMLVIAIAGEYLFLRNRRREAARA